LHECQTRNHFCFATRVSQEAVFSQKLATPGDWLEVLIPSRNRATFDPLERFVLQEPHSS
jgi:hypothetical protein